MCTYIGQQKHYLLSIIQKWIKPDSTIMSDCWKVYNYLEYEGYKHLTIRIILLIPIGASPQNIKKAWRDNIPHMAFRKKYYNSYII